MIEKGNKVKWEWGNGVTRGEVPETNEHEVEKDIGGRTYLSRGEEGNRALWIWQDDGSEVLKPEDEVKKL